jgi:hypothetical protein
MLKIKSLRTLIPGASEWSNDVSYFILFGMRLTEGVYHLSQIHFQEGYHTIHCTALFPAIDQNIPIHTAVME